ncbi:MAG: hypothetical protein SGI73_20145 [Chloroflexota bacterium]|nr:hypothetical protein [Chloroflexota bacterium]
MKFRLLLPGLLVLVLLTAACSAPELRDSKLLQDTSLATGDPCAAPCWRGITPGETSWSDARTILEDDTTLENLQVQTDENSPAAAAEWQQRGGSACCQAFTEDGETVSILFLRTAPTVTLGEVIDAHGEPSYAIGSPFSDTQAIVNVIYPSVPMVVYAFVPGIVGEISAGSEIIGVLYMTQKDMDLLITTSNLHDWEGYNPYSVYRGDEDAPFDITPSVTLTPTPTSES